MKSNRVRFLASILFLTASMILIAGQGSMSSARAQGLTPPVSLADPLRALPDSTAVCGSLLLQESDRAISRYVKNHPEVQSSARLQKTAWSFVVGSTHAWYAANFTNGMNYLTNSTCRAVGVNCYVFVEDSMWTTGRVTQSAVDSVMGAFDNHVPANPSKGVYQMDVDAFGNPPDVDNDPRIVLLLLNIRDGFSGSGGYVGGYFTSRDQFNIPESNLADIFYLDAYPQNLNSASGLRAAMSTTAHEFQHMIHWNYDHADAELTFLNEGCSLVAEVNCGYPIYDQGLFASEPNHYLFDWRRDSINVVLKDYSRAARFTTYIRDRFGMGFFKGFVTNNTLHGIPGINAALTDYGVPDQFNDVIYGWFIANILDNRSVDSTFGYLYPSLPQVKNTRFSTPASAVGTYTVSMLAAQYLSFVGKNNFNFVATWADTAVKLRAVEIGTPSRVLSVTSGLEFSEPGYGTSYKTIYLVAMNTSPTTNLSLRIDSVSTTTVTPGSTLVPRSTALLPSYPNPFNPETTIQFFLRDAGEISLKIYSIDGSEVVTLLQGWVPGGEHHVAWVPKGLASGVYICRLDADHQQFSRKIAFIK